MIPYLFLSVKENVPADSYWDQALIRDILKDPAFTTQQDGEGSIVILPGAYQSDAIKEINARLEQFKWVILLVTSDEESKFPVEEIKHPNISIYVQYPKVGRHEMYLPLPLGYTSETRKNLKLVEKSIDLFYCGQKTHERRIECSEAIAKMEIPIFVAASDTDGFAQGLSQEMYMNCMSSAKVAPCPSGAVSQDSFRLYEALEAGAIPIADDISPNGDRDFWRLMFTHPPFPVLREYKDLEGYTKDVLDTFQERANYTQAWWLREKRKLRNLFISDYMGLTGNSYSDPVTVIIPVSYIPSHPDVKILAETIKSVRYHFPVAEIVLTFDGLRKEHKEHRAEYEEFIRRALFYANTEWGPCYPLLFTNHTHQVAMARKALDYIKTDLILYVEQDTPLVTDEPIEWMELEKYILSGESNMIRFHFEAVIPEPHKHMMIGEPENHLLKTSQWSQRPHLASAAFYRRILAQYFTPDAQCFIEDKLHGALDEEYRNHGMAGWLQWRVHIYFPDEKNIKRSLNLDGREGSEKFDTTQIW